MDSEMKALFQDSLDRFNAEQHPHAKRLAADATDGAFDRQRYQQVCDLGWLELLRGENESTPPTVADLVPLAVAGGKGLWKEPVVQAAGECAGLLQASNEPPCVSLLEKIIEGSTIPAFAGREADQGWASAEAGTRASRVDGLYRLSGRKDFVLGGGADCFLVTATLEAGGQAVFSVDARADGLARQTFPTVDQRQAVRLELASVAGELLSEGNAQIVAAELRGRLLASAEAVGVMQGVNEATANYLRERKQFGRPLAQFQALQHRFVEMAMMARETAALVEAAADTMDRGAEETEKRVFQAWGQAISSLRHVTREGIQMHGGMGVTREMRVGHYYCRGLMLESLYGSADWTLDRLAAGF